MSGHRVVAGTQVHHDGVTYAGGEAVPLDDEADAAQIEYLTHAGWIEPVKATSSRKRPTSRK